LSDLEKGYSNIQAIVHIVNEATKEEANVRKIIQIQKIFEVCFFLLCKPPPELHYFVLQKPELLVPGRALLFEGTVNILEMDHKKKEPSQKQLYLFNDLLLIGKEKEKGHSEIFFKQENHLIEVSDIPSEGTASYFKPF